MTLIINYKLKNKSIYDFDSMDAPKLFNQIIFWVSNVRVIQVKNMFIKS